MMLTLVKLSYFLAAVLFILGLKRMSSPVTARRGIIQAGVGMVLATLATFFLPDLHNLGLMVLAIVIGTAVAWYSGKRVAMTDMPQMVALYNGMGGGSAAAIGAVALLAAVQAECGFEPGDLRCLFLESQPLHRQRMHWRVADAAAGPMNDGYIRVADLLDLQPWGARTG